MSETVADVVRVVFEATGQAELGRVFESIESRMGRFEKTTATVSQAGADARVKATVKEHKERMAAWTAMFKEIEKKEKEASKATDKAARDKAKSEANAARERLRTEEDLARSQARIRENSARYAGQLAEQQATAEIRAAKRAADEKERLAARQMATNKRWAGSIGGTVGGSMSRALGGVGMLAGAALAIGGGASFADSIRGELGAEKAAAVLSNSAYIKGASGASGQRFDPAALLGKAKGIQALTNIDKAEVLAGMQAFVAKTGSAEILGAGDNSVLEAAKLAKATGANFADVMSASGILRAQNKNLTTEQSAEMLRNVVAQGKTGAVEMSDLAMNAGKITASSAMYAADQTTTQRKLLGLAQVVYPVAGSVEEAATSITHLGGDILKHKKNFAALDLFDKKTGRLKDIDEGMVKILGATGGDLGKIQALGIGERSIKAFEAIAPDYQQSLAAHGGNKAAAMADITAQMSKFTNATMSKGDVENDLSVVMSQRAEKIDAAMMRLKEILADKGVPLFERFMGKLDDNLPAIERNVGKLADLIAWFADNPFKGLGALVLASVAKDLAGAAIGAGVKSAILTILNGASPPGLRTPGAPGGSGNAVPAAVAATAAIALLATTGDAADSGYEIGKQASKSSTELLSKTAADVRSGKATPEQAKAVLGNSQKLLDVAKENSDTKHQALDLAAVPLSPFSKDAREAIQQVHAADEVMKNSDAIVRGMAELAKALREAPKTIASNGGGNMAHPNDPTRSQSHGAPRAAQ